MRATSAPGEVGAEDPAVVLARRGPADGAPLAHAHPVPPPPAAEGPALPARREDEHGRGEIAEEAADAQLAVDGGAAALPVHPQGDGAPGGPAPDHRQVVDRPHAERGEQPVGLGLRNAAAPTGSGPPARPGRARTTRRARRRGRPPPAPPRRARRPIRRRRRRPGRGGPAGWGWGSRPRPSRCPPRARRTWPSRPRRRAARRRGRRGPRRGWHGRRRRWRRPAPPPPGRPGSGRRCRSTRGRRGGGCRSARGRWTGRSPPGPGAPRPGDPAGISLGTRPRRSSSSGTSRTAARRPPASTVRWSLAPVDAPVDGDPVATAVDDDHAGRRCHDLAARRPGAPPSRRGAPRPPGTARAARPSGARPRPRTPRRSPR